MTAPNGAPISPDGQYWWDEQAQQWQPLAQPGQPQPGQPQPGQPQAGQPPAGGSSGSSGSSDAGAAVIVFADVELLTESIGAGPVLGIDTADNPNNNEVPRADNGVQASWADFNRGSADAQAYSDTWTLDPAGSTQGSGSVDNLNLPMGQGTTRGVKLGRLPAGQYTFTVTLNGGVSLSDVNFQVLEAASA